MMGPPRMDRLAEGSEPETDGQPIVIRLGSIVAGGVLSALVSSFPASLRVGEHPEMLRALEQWIVLASVSTPLAVAGVAVLQRARVGVRVLLGDRVQRAALGVLWWGVLELTLLSIFGSLLRKTTHQHSLAGVTFAIFAIVSGLVLALFARRTATMLTTEGVQKIGLAIAGVCAFLGLLVVGLRLTRAEGMHAAAGFVDALVFVLTTGLASSRRLTRWRPLAIAGVPVAVLVLMVGLTTLRLEPSLRESLAQTAPMHSLVIELFGP